MALPILMPALSPTMTNGNLAKWLKKEGDFVKPGEVIAEIETDKATMEVESADSGKLAKIVIAAGTTNVAVNSLIGVLLEANETEEAVAEVVKKYQTTPAKPMEKEKLPVGKVGQASPTSETSHSLDGEMRIKISPLAKKIAQDSGVKLGGIKGSGPGGRIVKQDVLATAQSPSTGAASFARGERVMPQSMMRQVIASRLTESKQNIPHFYLTADCNLSKLTALRKELNEAALGEDGKAQYRISVNDFLIKAAAYGLKKVPEANSSWSHETIVMYDYVDISVAVSIDGGLITPIVADVQHKTLSAISSEVKELVSRAKNNQLKTEEFQGGTFTISNLGMYNVREFSAIINPPQSAILSVGAAEERVIVKDGVMVIATMMTITLSCDHRVIDGTIGAKLLGAIKNAIENPAIMLV
jgi:pyruvate dehydrogenase E2 component (dihydrolipoamide acetyltransferase)